MKKIKQADINPYPYTDSNKRYYTYDYYLRKTYGGKCAKLTLDAGFTCPNIDGRCGYGGCIYCSARGSGDFAADAALSIKEQYEAQALLMRRKWDTPRFIPYLQAHTNTYAPIERLREVYSEVLALEGAVAFHIATRADCLPREVLSLLREVSEKIPLTVELGLQSVRDDTARFIGRGHTYQDFLNGFYGLRSDVPKARIAVHLINGLPHETEDDMVENARLVGKLHPDEIKLHLLHVLKDTRLAKLYESGEYTPMSEEAYVDTVYRQLLVIPSDIVMGRLTGDGSKDALLAPLWSLKKLCVLNEIDRKLFENDAFQGRFVQNAQK